MGGTVAFPTVDGRACREENELITSEKGLLEGSRVLLWLVLCC